MQFSYPDWSTVHHKIWKQLLDQHLNMDGPVALVEVGSFEGRSTVWFADYLAYHPNSQMFCIDTWLGGEEIERTKLPFDMTEVFRNFTTNVREHSQRDKIKYHLTTSQRGLVDLLRTKEGTIDFIYLDGSHTQRDTLMDLTLSLCLLKPGGFIIVDDYLNSMATKNTLLQPRKAVEFVAESFDNEVSFFVTPERQAVIIKR